MAWAGAWNQPAGHGLIIATGSMGQSSRSFNAGHNLTDSSWFAKTESRVYIEHGFTQKLTFVGNGAYQKIGFEHDNPDTTSLEDKGSRLYYYGLDETQIGMQWQLHRHKSLAAALRGSYIFPSKVSETNPEIAPRDPLFELRALIGNAHETKLGSIFYDVQAAARVNKSGERMGERANIALGFHPHPKYSFIIEGAGLFEPEIDFHSKKGNVGREKTHSQINAQISLIRRGKKGRSSQIGLKQTVFGRNVVQENAVIMSTWIPY